MINFCRTESEVDELIEELLNPVRNERDRERQRQRETYVHAVSQYFLFIRTVVYSMQILPLLLQL